MTRPDGSVVELVPGTPDGASDTFTGTDLPGVYLVTPHLADAASAASPAPSARPAAASPGPSASPAESDASSRFAVALFDVNESTIAPGSAATIEALGAAAAASPAQGTGPTATERPTTRDEVWAPLVILALLGLCVEWAVYHRDALTRMRRSLAARFGQAPADGST